MFVPWSLVEVVKFAKVVKVIKAVKVVKVVEVVKVVKSSSCCALHIIGSVIDARSRD